MVDEMLSKNSSRTPCGYNSSMLGFKWYEIATSILSGIEAVHMMKKGQLH